MTSGGLSLETEAALANGLEDFFSKMWEEVEFNMGHDIAKFYSEDGSVSVGTNMDLCGKQAIERFYAYRREMGGRVSRHIVGNYRFDFGTFLQNARVRVCAIVTHYGTSGTPPLPSALPLGIYDSEMIFERQADSSWRIVRYRGEPFFLSADNPYWTLPEEMNPAAREKSR
ncbi:MAG TPA: hypothetical protein VN154_06190 [Rhizomicrobium sp.]|nr:hypothetical protein [Rhizomicrobium sp.]